jgi:hypothetical protein
MGEFREVVLPLRANAREESSPGAHARAPLRTLWEKVGPQVIEAINEYERDGWELVETSVGTDLLQYHRYERKGEVIINAILILSIIGIPFL